MRPPITVLLPVVAVAVGLSGCHAAAHSTSAPASAARASSPPHAHRGQAGLVRSARWTATSQGFRLVVTPTARGRAHADHAPQTALRQAVAAALPTPLSLSTSVRRSLRNQLLCHADFAATKPTWDLETWRPDVGFARTVEALCNP